MLLVWRRLSRVPWTARRSTQSILKEISPEYSLEDWCWSSNTLVTWRKELTHWESAWCWERLKVGGEGDDRGWDGGWHHQLNGHEFEQTAGVGDGQGGPVCCSPWGHKELDMTEQLNWTVSEFGFLETRRSWMDLIVSESWVMYITKERAVLKMIHALWCWVVWHSGECKNYRYSKEKSGCQGLRGWSGVKEYE